MRDASMEKRRMLPVYTRGRSQLSILRAALPTGATYDTFADWTSFQRALVDAPCAVIWLDWLGDGDALHRLTDVRRRLPDVPVVLVTRKDADNVRLLKGLVVEEVVWLNDAPNSLATAVARAETCGALHLVRAAIRSDRHLSHRLREMLLYACDRGHVVRSVTALGLALHCDRRTLWYAWHQAMPRGPRLEDFLHWLTILHATALRPSLRSWEEVAAELQIDKRTLARYATRLLGVELRDLSALDRRELVATFCATFVGRLLADPRLDNAP
ncbi:MAG TPA: hypothetical protein VHM30_04295 [Gemmatimonadaceae bacterium]|nr:hypothetical protein [Gemmatimonadaceae bacterium]